MAVAPGAMVGRYEIIRFLGAGGMGEVYLAHDRDLGRPVALKRLAPSLVESSGSRRDLREEARAAARLNHPAIAAVHDTFDHLGEIWLVMEYVEGESLAARIARGPATPDELASLGAQLADGVAHAHARGIVHRDLKPANVQLSPDGRVKILDFGVARRRPLTDVTAATSGASSIRVVGTPRYMAPEQFTGRSDEKSDVFSLGILLFELASGRPPFDGDDLQQLWQKVRSAARPDLAVLRPDLPPEVGDTVCRMLAVEPADRPSAEAVAAAFASARASLAGGETVVAGTVRRGMRRRPSGWQWLALAAVLVLLAGAGLWRAARSPAAASYRVAVVADAAAPPEPDQALTGLAASLARYLSVAPGVYLLDDAAGAEALTASSDAAPAGAQQRDTAMQRGADLVVALALEDTGAGVEAMLWTAGSTRALARLSEVLQPADSPDAAAYRLAGAVVRGLISRGRLPSSAGGPFGAPQHVIDEYLRGLTFLAQRYEPLNLDRAYQAFTRATESDPRFAPAQAALGTVLLLKHADTADAALLEGAGAAIARAREIDAGHPRVVAAHARLLWQSGNTSEAVSRLRDHLASHAADDEAHRLLGTLLIERRQLAEALPHLQQAVALGPSDWQNHSELGYAHLLGQQYEEAVGRYADVIRLAPGSSWGYQMRGTAYQLMDCEELALADYDAALKLVPDAFVFSNKGTLHYTAGDYAEAAQAYERAIELNESSPELRKNLGDAYAHLQRPENARQAWRAAADLCRRRMSGPDGAYAEALLASVEARLGEHGAAIGSADRAAAAAPTNADVLHFAAVAHALSGRVDRACQYAQQALAQGGEPNVVCRDEHLRALGDCRACDGKVTEARGGCV